MTIPVSFFVINTIFGLLRLIRFLFLIFYLKIMVDTPLYAKKCAKLLEESEIRFAGIVDKDGKLIAGGFKEGLVPYEGDETKLQSFFDFVSKASIRKEFDESLGPINYIAARRDKAVLVSFPFPITNILLLISAEPSVNIENFAKKVVEIFTDVN